MPRHKLKPGDVVMLLVPIFWYAGQLGEIEGRMDGRWVIRLSHNWRVSCFRSELEYLGSNVREGCNG